MTVRLGARADICVQSFTRVAWEGEGVEVAPDALALIARRRTEFLAFVAAHPDRKFYGVNVHAGEGSDRLLSASEQRDYDAGPARGHVVR